MNKNDRIEHSCDKLRQTRVISAELEVQ